MMSFTEVNDVFEELNDENKRLLNELLFANNCLAKCTNVLIDYKTFVDLIFDEFKHNIDEQHSKRYQELTLRAKEVIDNKDTDIARCSEPLVVANMMTNNTNESIAKVKQEKCDNFLDDMNQLEDETFDHKKSNTCRTQTKDFECDICGKRFSKQRNIAIHKSVKHKVQSAKKRFKACDFDGCDRVFSSLLLLKIHLESHKSGGQFSCPFKGCDRVFENENQIRAHIRFHKRKSQPKPVQEQSDKRLVCDWPGCEYRDSYQASINRHKLLVHTPDEVSRVFACHHRNCDKKFKIKYQLKCHLDTHEVSPTMCEICGRYFKNKPTMRKHRKTYHAANKQWACDYPDCHFKGTYRSQLALHKISHSDSRPFVCAVEGCGKRFAMEVTLKQHVFTHNTERNIKCSFDGCPKTFKTQVCAKSHFRTQHSGQEFRCEWPGCDYVTNTPKGVKVHGDVHKTERDFACQWPQCDKRFKSKTRLNLHIRRHTNDKRYVCSWPGCQYETVDSGNFIKHRKRVHEKNCRY